MTAILLLAAFVVGMSPELAGIHQRWTAVYGDFAHGYLLMGMGLVLAWRARKAPGSRVVNPWWPAVPMLLAAVLLMTASRLVEVDSIAQGLIPVVLFLTVAAARSLRAAVAYAGAMALLYFGLPVWWPLNAPLQHLTAAVANLFVDAIGLPAYVEGNVFHLPAGVVEVASGCSGLNFLLAGLALAWFQGQMYLRSGWSRMRLLGAAIGLSLVANWVRVSALVWIGYVSDMQHYLIRVDHLYFGWALFLLAIWPLALYAARLERLEEERGAGASATNPAASAKHDGAGVMLRSILAALILLLPVGVQPLLAAMGSRQSPPRLVMDGLQGAEGHALGPDVGVPGAIETRARWLIEGRSVDYYGAYVPSGAAGTAFPRTAADLLGRQWRQDGPLVVERDSRDRWFEQQEGVLLGQRYVVRSGLLIAGHSAAAGRAAKIAALRGLLRGRGDRQLWVLLARCELDCAGARTRMDEAARLLQFVAAGS